MKRVLAVITDQLVVGHGIIDTIRRTPGLELVGSVGSRVSVPPMARRLAPDVVLVDHCGPTDLALERLTDAEQRLTGVKRVLLTARKDKAWLDAAFAAGAHAVIMRDVRPAHLGIVLLELAEDHVIQRPDLSRSEAELGGVPLTPRGARDPAPDRARVHEPPHRGPPLGDRADGQVPPLQHLSQARREQPHGSDALRLHARPRGSARGAAGGLSRPGTNGEERGQISAPRAGEAPPRSR